MDAQARGYAYAGRLYGCGGAHGDFALRDRSDRCGAYARCTTCRIEYLEGEHESMCKAELEVLENRNLLGQVRLSYQALCDHDVTVRVLMTTTSTSLDDPGLKPKPEITPPPEWVEKPV